MCTLTVILATYLHLSILYGSYPHDTEINPKLCTFR